MKNLYIGIDIGTTGVRAIAFDKNGFEKASSYKEYPLLSDDNMKAELDPDLVFDSFLYVLKKCTDKIDKKNISGIGLSSQMHSLILMDDKSNLITNVITWADGRALEVKEYIENEIDHKLIYKNTGCKITHPSFPFAKLLWLQKRNRNLFNKTKKILTIKSYILYKLFGEFFIDVSDASSLGLFNLHEYTWDKQALTILNISVDMLPTLKECTDTITGAKKELIANVPITIGSTDGLMANLGCGIFDDSKMSCTIGTSGAIRTAKNTPTIDKKQRIWCYALKKDMYVCGGAVNNGGITLRWLRDTFFNKNDKNIYKKFDDLASSSPVGSNGLVFLPFLTGERSPYWDRNMKGGFSKLSVHHNKKDIVRSVMEGVLLNLYTVFNIIIKENDNIKTLVANGGYAKSDIWLQMQADIFNKEIKLTEVYETSALGAAYLAMYSSGAISSLNIELDAMKTSKIIYPNKENSYKYKSVYENFITEVNKNI